MNITVAHFRCKQNGLLQLILLKWWIFEQVLIIILKAIQVSWCVKVWRVLNLDSVDQRRLMVCIFWNTSIIDYLIVIFISYFTTLILRTIEIVFRFDLYVDAWIEYFILWMREINFIWLIFVARSNFKCVRLILIFWHDIVETVVEILRENFIEKSCLLLNVDFEWFFVWLLIRIIIGYFILRRFLIVTDTGSRWIATLLLLNILFVFLLFILNWVFLAFKCLGWCSVVNIVSNLLSRIFIC